MTTVTIKPIHNEADYHAALTQVERLMDTPDNPENDDAIQLLAMLIVDYEDRHYPIAAPDPIAFLKFVMEAKGLTRKDLEPYIGGRGRVSDVLNRKPALTIDMIRRLTTGLDLPADALIQSYPLASRAT